MRIALVSRELYPYVGGGIAPIVAAQARLLSQIADVTVVTSSAHRELHDELERQGDARLPSDDVRLVFVDEPTEDTVGSFYSHMHAWSGRVHDALREVYRDRGPDLIEFCDYLGEGFVTVQASHTGAPWLEHTLVAIRLHTSAEMCSVLNGHIEDDFATVATHDAERYCLRHADRLLWSGGDVLECYRRYYGRAALAPATRIRDGFFAYDDEDPGRAGGPVDGHPVRFLYVGRLERRKGVQNLLRAVTTLARDDFQLVLLGGDTATAPLQTSLRDQLELMAAGDERIVFADPVARAAVGAAVRERDVVIVPSLWECWPNTAREALMYNRPVLATPVGGLLEMAIPGRSGWLAGGTSARAIAQAIEARLDDRDEITELIAAGGPRAVFEELTDATQFLRAYEALLADRRPRAGRVRRSRDPLVSVVVPYFRLHGLVGATLDSIEAQDYPQIETILVNDGSLEAEDAVLERLAERPGVSMVTQPNAGLGAARNLGVTLARGAYVLPLDADDIIDPRFVSRCVDAMEHDDDLAYVGTWVEYMDADAAAVRDPNGGYVPLGNWSRLLELNNVAGTCTTLIRRSIFERGFRYSTDLTSYEDWFLYRELADAQLFGAIIPERLFRYRLRPESMIRETGAPLVGRLMGEMRAHIRERSVRWTAEDDRLSGSSAFHELAPASIHEPLGRTR